MGLSIRTPDSRLSRHSMGQLEPATAIFAPMGSPWTAKTVLVNLCHNRYQLDGALSLSDGVLLSGTGLSIRTPGCQGTEWVSLNLNHQQPHLALTGFQAVKAERALRSGPCPASAIKTHDLTTTTTSACPLRCQAPSSDPTRRPFGSRRRWLLRWRASTRSPRPAQGPQTRLGPAAGGASRSTAARSRSCVVAGLPGPAQLGRGEAVCARGQFPHCEARPPTCASEGGSAAGVRKLVMLPCATRGTCARAQSRLVGVGRALESRSPFG
jgi:hypothetical protein